jgi:hypothetical protein
MGRNRYFSRIHDGTPISELTRGVALDPLTLSGTETREVVASTSAGRLAAAFHVARWRGAGRPALVYLHGSGERPFDLSRRAKNTFRTAVLAADPDGMRPSWSCARRSIMELPAIMPGPWVTWRTSRP